MEYKHFEYRFDLVEYVAQWRKLVHRGGDVLAVLSPPGTPESSLVCSTNAARASRVFYGDTASCLRDLSSYQ